MASFAPALIRRIRGAVHLRGTKKAKKGKKAAAKRATAKTKKRRRK
jgi:hypothetical protein